jgi:hypothetical protein
MGLIDDFATWTEKTRRSLLRDHGARGKAIGESLPPGVPVSAIDGIAFIDALVEAAPPEDLRGRALKWREKLCRTPNFRHGHSFPA